MNAPKEWQGKGADAAIDQYTKLANAVKTYIATPQAPKAPSPPPKVKSPMPDNKDLWFSKPDEAASNLRGEVNQETSAMLQAALTPFAQAAADNAKRLSKSDPKNKVVWEKFGQEIEELGSKVPLQYQGNVDLWDQTTRLVRSNHEDVFIQEAAAAIAAQGSTLGVASGGTSSASGAAADTIAEKFKGNEYGEYLLSTLGENGIRRAVEKMQDDGVAIDIDKYAKMVADTNVTRHPDGWKNADLMRGSFNG